MGEKIVGHKTRYDGTHEPLYEGEANAILERACAADKERREAMPDSMSALHTMHDAMTRLRDEGWREGMYCPKDGTEFAIIQFGSTGIFSGFYSGKWPDGYVYMCDCCEQPKGLMWKAINDLSEAERQKMDECMKADRQMQDAFLKSMGALSA